MSLITSLVAERHTIITRLTRFALDNDAEEEKILKVPLLYIIT